VHGKKSLPPAGESYTKREKNQYENKPHISRMDKKHGATGLGGRLEPADGLRLQLHGANKPTGSKAA
jgi:hypothetical protein